MTGHMEFTLIMTALWLSALLIALIACLVYWSNN